MKTDKELKKEFNTFKLEMKQYIMTTRFTNETWSENREYVNGNKGVKCIYCAPDPIKTAIPINTILFVLEMNNSENKIMGIGMIKNHAICGKYKVYNKENYNRFVYPGKNRISREEMSEDEEEIIEVFEELCFKGNKHMKRGQGIKGFPVEILFKCKEKLNLNLVEKISSMFKIRLKK